MNTAHSVLEEGEQLDIQVGVLDGSLQRKVVLSYTIANLDQSGQNTTDDGECTYAVVIVLVIRPKLL